MFIIFSEQERRYQKMGMKIVCFILLVHTSTNLAAPATDSMQRIRFHRESENGSGDSCCVRRPKLEVLESRGINIYIFVHFCRFVEVVVFYCPHACMLNRQILVIIRLLVLAARQ